MIATLCALVGWAIATISRHERALQESERRLTDTLESIGDGFVTIDSDWRYRFINRQAARLIGQPSAQLLGTRVWDIYPENEHSGCERAAPGSIRTHSA